MVNLHQLKSAGVPLDNHYELKRRIGGGGFSEVWLAHDKRSNVDVALKVYSSTQELDEEGVRMFRREFSLVCNLNHTNILKPFTFDIYQGCPYIVLPYCEKGSASRLIGKITEEELWDFTGQVAAGLAYMHRHNIIHQDIKPANVLVNADDQYMITDFGISTGLRNTIRMTCGVEAGTGTTEYMSYECLDEKPRNVMARDIWAFGVTLYELMTGDVPFGKFGGMTQKAAGGTVPEIKGPRFSSGMKNLAYACLALEPWDRPSAEEIVRMVEQRRSGGAVMSVRRGGRRKGRWLWKVAAAACVAVAAVGAVGMLRYGDGQRHGRGAAAGTDSIDRLYIDKVEQAASMVRGEEGKNNMMQVDEEVLCRAAQMYESASGMHPADSVLSRGQGRWQAAASFIDSTYVYLYGQGVKYSEVGAADAARQYGRRSTRLKPFASQRARAAVEPGSKDKEHLEKEYQE